MNILEHIDIKLSKEDIEKIINNYLTEQGYTATKYTFNVTPSWTGYGPSETCSYLFSGITINATKLNKEN